MKGNPVTGTATGRLGNTVTSIVGGQQVVRTLNLHPQNPRTREQMKGRVQMSNLITGFQTLKPHLRGLFQDRPPILSDCNMLVKLNLNRTPVWLEKEEAEMHLLVAAPYQISQGSLPPIRWHEDQGRLVSSLLLPPNFHITPATTVGQASLALCEGNPFLQAGDKLMVIYLRQNMEHFGPTPLPCAKLETYELTIEPSRPAPLHAFLPPKIFDNCHGRMATGAQLEEGALTYIHIRQTNNKRLISTQTLVLTPGNTTYAAYSSEAKLDKAIQSYQKQICSDTSP